MDSFTDDLSSPLPKQMHASPRDTSMPEMMEGVVMQRSSLPIIRSCDIASRSEAEGRNVMLRPLSERLGRTVLKRTSAAAVVNLQQKPPTEDPWSQLSDDMVENILARLPLFPLKSSKKVCKRWEAITNTREFEILHKQLGEQQPWFVCYGINHLVRSKSQAFAFDEESNTWITLPPLQFPSHNSGTLACAGGLVYAIAGPGEDMFKYKLTSSTSSPSSFGDTWYETPRMEFPRSSPVVCVVHGTGRAGTGHKVVVAGGVPEFEPEHMAVEVFDSETGAWEVYGDLPEDFSGSSSRTWISGVVCDNKLYLSLIHSWSIHVLDLCTKEWTSIQWEHPQGLIYHHIMAIGTTLVVAGLCEQAEQPEESVVKIWKLNSKTNSLIQIGSMPREVFSTTLGRNSEEPTLNFLLNENLLYVSKADTQDGALVVGEISLEECKTEWRELLSVPTLGHRFDSLVTFSTSISISPQISAV